MTARYFFWVEQPSATVLSGKYGMVYHYRIGFCLWKLSSLIDVEKWEGYFINWVGNRPFITLGKESIERDSRGEERQLFSWNKLARSEGRKGQREIIIELVGSCYRLSIQVLTCMMHYWFPSRQQDPFEAAASLSSSTAQHHSSSVFFPLYSSFPIPSKQFPCSTILICASTTRLSNEKRRHGSEKNISPPSSTDLYHKHIMSSVTSGYLSIYETYKRLALYQH